MLTELFCPLHCLVNSTLWFLQLSKLISFQVHQLFGPPKLCLVPCTCVPCAATLRTECTASSPRNAQLSQLDLVTMRMTTTLISVKVTGMAIKQSQRSDNERLKMRRFLRKFCLILRVAARSRNYLVPLNK